MTASFSDDVSDSPALLSAVFPPAGPPVEPAHPASRTCAIANLLFYLIFKLNAWEGICPPPVRLPLVVTFFTTDRTRVFPRLGHFLMTAPALAHHLHSFQLAV